MRGAIAQLIGTAQDAGVPQLGCDCINCRRARRDTGMTRYPSSVALRLPARGRERVFIIDASAHLSAQMDLLPGRAPTPDGILLTHLHCGHYAGLLHLGRECLAADGLPVFCTQAAAGFLAENQPWRSLVRDGYIDLEPVEFGASVYLGPLRVQPLEIPHRDEHSDTCAYLVSGERSMIYLPDIDSWDGYTEEFNAAVRRVDYAFIDGTFYSGDELGAVRARPQAEVPHPPVEETLDLMRRGKLCRARRATYFTHLNHTNPLLDEGSEAYRRVMTAGCRVAAEGLSIPLGGGQI